MPQGFVVLSCEMLCITYRTRLFREVVALSYVKRILRTIRDSAPLRHNPLQNRNMPLMPCSRFSGSIYIVGSHTTGGQAPTSSIFYRDRFLKPQEIREPPYQPALGRSERGVLSIFLGAHIEMRRSRNFHTAFYREHPRARKEAARQDCLLRYARVFCGMLTLRKCAASGTACSSEKRRATQP